MEAKNEKQKRPRMRYLLLILLIVAVLVPTTNRGMAVAVSVVHSIEINSAEYKARHGKWDFVEVPEELRINAIHAVMLPTGKVLLIAGSGNDRQQFEAGTFESLIYDPATGDSRLLETPEDLFCAGHAFLPNGNLLVAGGTQDYEILEDSLEQAGGILTIRNEDPTRDITIPEGTLVTGDLSGLTYRTDSEVMIPAADIQQDNGRLWPGDRNVYVVSTDPGTAGVYENEDTYLIDGLSAADSALIYGVAPKMSMDKKEYQGIDSTYEFDPWAEEYIEVDPMHYARWYPTLTNLPDGHIIALSGIDGGGKVLEGQTEIYDPSTQQWVERKDLRRYFPTYPSVFQTATPGVLFSAGPSTGWGPQDEGREPGFWTLEGNTFEEVEGLRDAGLLETASAGWLGPVNDQRLVVIGGGGVGEAEEASTRIDVIDLDGANPAFEALSDLPQETRYPSFVTLPTGDALVTNGSSGYRGKGGSDILKSYLLGYEDGSLEPLADPQVGRNYHSSALLLPNGQVLVAGSDPLFLDKDDTVPGKFEQRIEIFSPPYLFTSDDSELVRPVIDEQVGIHVDGTTLHLTYEEGEAAIDEVRLARPGAVTHVTDTNQRLIDLDIVSDDGEAIEAEIPDNPALVPPGFYMLYLVDANGVPSIASWVQVGVPDGNGDTEATHVH